MKSTTSFQTMLLSCILISLLNSSLQGRIHAEALAVNAWTTMTPAFYKLALQWPPSVCISMIPQDFKIHGLWPHNTNDITILGYDSNNNCVSPAPNQNNTQIKNMITMPMGGILNNEWPNLYGDNDAFWFAEWDKHGTCSDFSQNPIAYFTQSSNLRRNLAQVLGLKVGTTNYTAGTVAGIVHNLTGKSPEVNCRSIQQKGMRSPQLFLAGIRICYSPPTNLKFQAQAATDCPKPYSGYCHGPSDSIKFPV